MLNIFNIAQRGEKTGKRENGRSRVKKRKGTRLQTIEETEESHRLK
jgi:hypothetical protein